MDGFGCASQVLVAIVAVLVTIFFLRRATGGAAVARDAVLLIGPTDSGKTTLLSLLCAGTAPPRGTVTSMVGHPLPSTPRTASLSN